MDAPEQWSEWTRPAVRPAPGSESAVTPHLSAIPLEPLALMADRPALRSSYTCPGEERPISRAVHLSRLASFYPACRECPHRTDTGQLPADICERIQSTERRIERSTLFGPLGVRGVYLNELDRKKAGEIAAAMASLLWQDLPAPAPSEEETIRWANASRRGPTVLVGRDDRPSSPDIATGVARSLCRMGCHVVDVGQCSRPTFLFAMEHLHATAGVFVSGSGHDPSWTGLDLAGAGGIPWNRDDRLAEVEHRLQTGFPRPARNAGGQRVFHPLSLYEAGFWQHFHALRPLKIVFGCASRPIRETVRRIFERLACRLITLAVPIRARRLQDPADADAVRFQKGVLESQAHLGILIEDDGQSCALFDERGQLIPVNSLIPMFAALALSESPGGSVLVPEAADPAQAIHIGRLGGRCLMVRPTPATISRKMAEHHAVFAADGHGRYWFHDGSPSCDAILTLAKTLQALSRSDAEFSLVAAPVKG